MKQYHSAFAREIPHGIRICGENLYAKHSIHYDSLPSYFLAFSVWDNSMCLSWSDTLWYLNEIAQIKYVPVLYDEVFDNCDLNSLYTGVSTYGPIQEGFVIRLYDSFTMDTFNTSVAKYVRAGHVQTDEHWSRKPVIKNELQ